MQDRSYAIIDGDATLLIKRLIWTIWTPMSSVLKKADKLNLSLSLSCSQLSIYQIDDLIHGYGNSTLEISVLQWAIDITNEARG